MHCAAISDFLRLDELLTLEERQVREAVAAFVDREVRPVVGAHYEAGTFPEDWIGRLGALGVFGATLDTHGCPGVSPTAYGLMMMELERGDSGLRSMASVQGALVMWPIATYGTPEQRDRWLPALRTGEAVGCFGLTEPDFGSDPAGMRTRARRTDQGWVLDGTKTWITNGHRADVAVIWAREEGAGEGPKAIRAFLVPTDTPGFSATPIQGKLSMRASVTSTLHLEEVALPASAALPGARGLGRALACLNEARFGIAFGAVGAALACFDQARRYAGEREQFGRPLGAFQLTQAKLADMLTRVTNAQNLVMRLGRLKAEGALTPAMVSLGKRHCVEAASEVARSARDLLGANGITLDYEVMRHLANLETLRTYEGTHDIHTLVLGREVTGLAAFS